MCAINCRSSGAIGLIYLTGRLESCTRSTPTLEKGWIQQMMASRRIPTMPWPSLQMLQTRVILPTVQSLLTHTPSCRPSTACIYCWISAMDISDDAGLSSATARPLLICYASNMCASSPTPSYGVVFRTLLSLASWLLQVAYTRNFLQHCL